MRFRYPKNGHFRHYCFDCEHYELKEQIGCAYIGICKLIKGEPTEQDAYDPMCGAWRKREEHSEKDEDE